MPESLKMLTVLKLNWFNSTGANFYVAKHLFLGTQKGQKPIPTKTSSKHPLRILVWSDVTFQASTAYSGQSFADGNNSFCAEILQVFNANPQHHHTPSPPFPP